LENIPLSLLRSSQRGPRLAYRIGLGPLIGGIILLLTTTGRKSGLPRTTALQYEKCGGDFLVASFRGTQADWYRNLAAYPQAVVQAGRRCLEVQARLSSDPLELADFLRLRLERHPRMVGTILRFEGVQMGDEAALSTAAARLALAVLSPVPSER